MTAIDIKVMVKRWKEENERINKEHEDTKNCNECSVEE
jgi:hypothetical protein